MQQRSQRGGGVRMDDQAADVMGRLREMQLAALAASGGPRVRRALAVGAAVQTFGPPAKQLLDRLRHRGDYTVTVEGTDDIYPDLHKWVLDRLPEQHRRALIATTDLGSRAHDIEHDGPQGAAVSLRYDGRRQHDLTLDGHKIAVEVEREEVPGGSMLASNWRRVLERVTFTASCAAGRDAIVAVLVELVDAKRQQGGPPPLLIASKWAGSWVRRRDLPRRDIGSVVLKGGQLERLLDDMGAFLAGEQQYNRVSQPWHRGYLFHGAPGTGKTSVARALAGHFNLPVYYLPLGDLSSDTDLMGLVGEIQPRSMLLLEDVDVFHAAVERSDEHEKTSVAAMLNALDGVWTPHGLITVMTTNAREKLDGALLRAGRVDVDEELTVLDGDQAARLAAQFDAGEIDVGRFVGASPATMIQALRRQTTTKGETC